MKSALLLFTGAAIGSFLTFTFFPQEKASPPSRSDFIDTSNQYTAAIDSSQRNATGEPRQTPPIPTFTQRYESLLELPNSQEKVASLRALFKEWGAEEGPTAFAFAKSLTGRDHLAFLASAAEGWAMADPDAAWRASMIASNDGAIFAGALQDIIASVAKNDPLLATNLLFEIKSPTNRSRVLGGILGELNSTQDRVAVLNAILAKAPSANDPLVQSFFKHWGRFDTDGPLEQIAALRDPSLAETAMIGVLEGWASSDGKGAFDYVVASNDPALLENALLPIAKQWAAASTADEIAALVDDLSQLENSDSVLKGLIPTLAFANPELAVASAQSFAEETARANHTRDALSIWASSDLAAAETFFRSMPSSREKQYAIWGLFNPAIQQNVPAHRIVGYVDAFEDQEARVRTLHSMAEYTRVRDLGDQTKELAASIVDYLEKSDLPAESREKIRSMLSSPEG